ncbi:MAG: HD domain-containing protein [Deltaproteobacteria bacterium]|nr:HD domain-containing protein [Deltaproteobacteria bacterium]
MSKADRLREIRVQLDDAEESRLAPWACRSRDALRKKKESAIAQGHRQSFSLDADRILHSHAYSRYIDKTQVFYLIKNDHITHRVLHVQLVSKIARTCGRLLSLNEDLIEAIALGHDIGHCPFGHDGERLLSELSLEHGLGHFLHNIQGVRFLQEIERKGKGWNLSLQVLDGILCHDGEVHNRALRPHQGKTFARMEEEIKEKQREPMKEIWPATMEGCVVRMADTISYVGRDIEDAIRLGIVTRKEVPEECRRVLGETNGTIVYILVEDLVFNSLERNHVCFSKDVSEALRKLKDFNYHSIYMSERVKKQTSKIKIMLRLLFEKYLNDLETGNQSSDIYTEFLEGMIPEYADRTSPAEIARDFIAGMTDEYFLSQCRKHLIPQVLPAAL